MIENVKKINLILQLRKHGVTNHRVLSILEKIPREQFIDKELFYKAYQNNALPIDCNQTISQPGVVAMMTQILEPKKNYKVLEIGTGSGYQTAVLSKLFRIVYTIERYKLLFQNAKNVLAKLKEKNSQFLIVKVPPPSRMQLEEIGDDLIRRTNSLVMRLTKIKTNTGLRIRAAVQNEFIETKIATLATKKIDNTHVKIESEGKFLGVLKRKQILGSYFKSTEKDDEIFIKKVNLYFKLNDNLKQIETIKEEEEEESLKNQPLS